MAFQDAMRNNFCWGCGADNPDGLHLRSTWDGDGSVARWTPAARFAAGPRHILNGGVIATLLDCHGVCTAIADAYRRAGREIGTDPEIWFATSGLDVRYLRPTPIASELALHGTVVTVGEDGTTVECLLEAEGKTRASAVVHAVQVPESWRHGRGNEPRSP